MAAHAARSLITTLPYAIENHSGINAMYSTYDDPARQPLPKSSTQFFQFELFPERGSGGMRKYGQDIKHAKSLTLYIGNTVISIDDMDGEINKSRSAHYISEYRTHVFTSVVKRGNSTVRLFSLFFFSLAERNIVLTKFLCSLDRFSTSVAT